MIEQLKTELISRFFPQAENRLKNVLYLEQKSKCWLYLTSHWGNSLLYRNRKVEIEAAICLRFFHGKNKNMATSLMSDINLKKFVVIFQKVQKNPSFD